MTFQFGLLAIDQLIHNAVKYRSMSGGQFKCPMVVRGPNGPAEFLGGQHSQSFASYFVHVPGFKVVAPSTPYDAKGLLKAAIRDDNPVIFLESEMSYGHKGEVPEEEYLIEIGKADVKRAGEHVTLVSFSKPVLMCLAAAEELAKEGIQAEVVDLRSLAPLKDKVAQKRHENRGLLSRSMELVDREIQRVRPQVRGRSPYGSSRPSSGLVDITT